MKELENWLRKAENDLASANKLRAGHDPINDAAIYHAQQCAEKILKAFMLAEQIDIPRTHDLELLIEILSEVDSAFSQLTEYAEALTPYATAFRYPGIDFEPSDEEVAEAIRMAESILAFTREKLTGRNWD